jgi:hypothetical protein
MRRGGGNIPLRKRDGDGDGIFDSPWAPVAPLSKPINRLP